jgi:AcrR family transcriptional regulator
MSNERMFDGQRKAQILAKAVEIATTDGFGNVTKGKIAAELGISPQGVMYHWGTMHALLNAVMEKAIQMKIYPIIAHGLVMGHGVAVAAPAAIRTQALARSMR